MASSRTPVSFYLDKDQFLYIDLVPPKIAESKPRGGKISSFKPRLRRLLQAITPSLPKSFSELPVTLVKNWHLGFTSFGGPPVQFQMVNGSQDLVLK
jgi:hypothetical protein